MARLNDNPDMAIGAGGAGVCPFLVSDFTILESISLLMDLMGNSLLPLSSGQQAVRLQNSTEYKCHARIIKGVFGVKTPLYVDLYFYAAAFALRTGALRSLNRVPPTISYCEESSPKLALTPARTRLTFSHMSR